jgi:hypothetical protein
MTGKSTLLVELQNAQRDAVTGRARCAMGKVMAELPEGDREQLNEALTDRSIYGSTVSQYLRSRGFGVSSYSVNRHRRQSCACYDRG